MTTHDIVGKLWNLCNVLKDDGVTSAVGAGIAGIAGCPLTTFLAMPPQYGIVSL